MESSCENFETIRNRNTEMYEDSKLKVKNPNVIAYLIRKRIGRSSREFLDRMSLDPLEVQGSQAGKIQYFLNPEKKIVYNTFPFMQPGEPS